MSASPSPISRTAVLITGMGVVSPLGIGSEPFWRNLLAGQSGVRRITHFDPTGLPVEYGGEVPNFDPKHYVRPRKSLKVMSREIQFAFTAADLALRDAGLQPGQFPPERLGVVWGADMIYPDVPEFIDPIRACMVEGKFDFARWGTEGMPRIMPLWLLKFLPNMPASHVAIANDARGPCNSIILNEVSALVALAEGVRLIERGLVDMVIVGGVGARLHPTTITFRAKQQLANASESPPRACRPFAKETSGQVLGEGAGALILESAGHAAARQARSYGRVAGYANCHEPRRPGKPLEGTAIRAALAGALAAAECSPAELNHIQAHGVGVEEYDAAEARAIRAVAGDVPVTAYKGHWGNLGAGCGGIELAAALLAMREGILPPTLNCNEPSAACPINVVRGEPRPIAQGAFAIVSHAPMGQAAAVCVRRE